MKENGMENKNFSLSVWKRSPFFRPYYKYFAVTVSLNVVLVLMDAAVPLFQSYAIDQFIIPDTLDGIEWFVVIYGLAIIVQTVSLFLVCVRQFILRCM